MKSNRLAAKRLGSSRPVAAFATLVGAIIGVGMFGIPYAVSRSGFWPSMAVLVVVTFGMAYLHRAFAELVSGSAASERLGFHVRKYFGRLAETALQFVVVASRIGVLLAYLVVGSHFTAILLTAWLPVEPNVGFLTFFVLGALGVWFGRRFVTGAEIPLAVLLIAGVAAVVWLAGPVVRPVHLAGWQPSALILPYGVMLFALAGIPAIPEIRPLVASPRVFRRIVVAGTVVPAMVYAAFAAAVVGVNGMATTPETAVGLSQALGPQVGLVIASVGFLAVITSFFVVGLNLAHLVEYDWGWPRAGSRLAVLATPVVLFGIGFNNFIEIVGAVGAVLIAIEGLFIIAAFERWQTAFPHGQPRSDGGRVRSRWGSAFVAAMLVAGAAWYFFNVVNP